MCTDTGKVLAQPRDGLTLLEQSNVEFKALTGAGFEINDLNEGDRRSKSQADAFTTDNYNVYYVEKCSVFPDL